MTGSERFDIWSTTTCLLVTDEACLPHAREILDAELRAVEKATSRFAADSELARLNEAGGRTVAISALFAEITAEALRVARATDGAVDPTVGGALIAAGYDRDLPLLAEHGPPLPESLRWRRIPGWHAVELDVERRTLRLAKGVRLDLGATAKAFAADHAARAIAEATSTGVLVNLGGDLAAAGPAPHGGWPVRVTEDHRAGPDAPGQTVTVTGGGLATSTTTLRRWRRGDRLLHHIIDPSTGAPARTCWRTASVAATTGVDANAAATAALVWGDAAVQRLTSARLPARLISTSGVVHTLSGWPSEPTVTNRAEVGRR